jgi:hypothetical protein
MSTKDKLGKLRRKSSVRIVVILILMVIVGLMFYFWKSFRIWLVGIFIVLLAA